MMDTELAVQLFKGNYVAFDEIYSRYWSRIYNEAYKRLRNVSLCEELVQDVFASLWVNRGKKIIENIPAYLSSAVRYQVFMQYKKGKAMPVFEEPLEHMAVTDLQADGPLHIKQLKGQIDDWLAMQPEKRREVFKMRFMDDLSTREISEILGISQKTVQNQLTTATKDLKKMLGDAYILSLILIILKN